MDIQITQIIFQIINFSVVMGALGFLLYKPVLKIFDERALRIEEGQKAAQEAIEKRENLEKMEGEVQKKLKKDRVKILDEAQNEAKERAQAILAEAKEKAQAEIEKGKKSWQEERKQLMKEARTEMAEAAIKAAELIVGEALKADKKAQQKLVDQELNRLLKQV